MQKLPKKFSHLQRWADEWALPTQMKRLEKRLSSNIEELRAFYDAVTPELDDIVLYLSKVELDNMSKEDKALLGLCYGMAMVAPAIELFGQPAVVCGFDARKFLPTHEPTSDRPAMSIAHQSFV